MIHLMIGAMIHLMIGVMIHLMIGVMIHFQCVQANMCLLRFTSDVKRRMGEELFTTHILGVTQ